MIGKTRQGKCFSSVITSPVPHYFFKWQGVSALSIYLRLSALVNTDITPTIVYTSPVIIIALMDLSSTNIIIGVIQPRHFLVQVHPTIRVTAGRSLHSAMLSVSDP